LCGHIVVFYKVGRKNCSSPALARCAVHHHRPSTLYLLLDKVYCLYQIFYVWCAKVLDFQMEVVDIAPLKPVGWERYLSYSDYGFDTLFGQPPELALANGKSTACQLAVYYPAKVSGPGSHHAMESPVGVANLCQLTALLQIQFINNALCNHCVLEAKCPECGKKAVVNDEMSEVKCSHCGFSTTYDDYIEIMKG